MHNPYKHLIWGRSLRKNFTRGFTRLFTPLRDALWSLQIKINVINIIKMIILTWAMEILIFTKDGRSSMGGCGLFVELAKIILDLNAVMILKVV